jgi:predicted Zn-dependent protease
MVCATIVQNSALYNADITVLVLNDKTVNAFAVPGGYIFVTLGLVKQCRDESELAGVIAHEIAHVYRRHGLQEMSKRIAGIRADVAFGELEEEVGEPTEEEKEMEALVDQTYEKIVHPRLLSYEIEADRIGAILAANAGYDPFGLVRISERVARVSTETPDIFDADYMLPSDAVKRSKEIRAFAEKTFTTEAPGEQMTRRFAAATSPVR